jgi:hypothetical protein
VVHSEAHENLYMPITDTIQIQFSEVAHHTCSKDLGISYLHMNAVLSVKEVDIEVPDIIPSTLYVSILLVFCISSILAYFFRYYYIVKSSMIYHPNPCSFPVLLHYKKTHVAMAMFAFSNFEKQKNNCGLTNISYLT